MTALSGGEAIVEGLKAHGVDTVFGLPGAQIYGLFDGFATVAAEGDRGAARAGLRLHGVRLCPLDRQARVFSVVPGPGVLNAGAALLTAFGCNEPVLCLTGQVPTAFLGKGRGHLHEMPDQLATLRSFVKWAERIEHPGARADAGRAGVPGDAVGPARTGGAGNAVGRLHPARRGRSGAATVRSVRAAAARSGPHQGRRQADRREQERR